MLHFPTLAHLHRSLLPGLLLALATACTNPVGTQVSAELASPRGRYRPQTRTYYVAADELLWDYAPNGIDVVTGEPFTPEEAVFVEGDGATRVGSAYLKALYREYTDDTFTKLAPRHSKDAYLGLLGPVLRGAVGDTLRVVFKNNGSHHYSMHPHGVFYAKDSEGALTNDGTSGADKADDMVEPGETHVYEWQVPERAGPGPDDPSSLVWLYHSHAIGDEYAGLVGAIVVTSAAHATRDALPDDVDRELVSFFGVMDENLSTLAERGFSDLAPEADPDDEEFYESNLMHSINGYVYGNGPRPVIEEGTRVRWHLIALGTEVDLHTPHWHGNVVLEHGHRTDVVELLPASMKTVDMVPDDPGTWMFHCHVNDHIAAGMIGLYDVRPARTN
jgi:hephaestin